MKIMSDEKGFITVFLLAMIFIIVTIMGAGIVFINNGNKRAWSTARSNQALYLAEAGIEKAIQDLKTILQLTGIRLLLFLKQISLL
ncbi:MAG: hypothetical protein ACOX6A_03000 [Atribacter sp.]|uniref:hypothetical protein n=1 Tax=Atribacter sp. TaxID=2847780 RepID=UPI003D97DDE9